MKFLTGHSIFEQIPFHDSTSFHAQHDRIFWKSQRMAQAGLTRFGERS